MFSPTLAAILGAKMAGKIAAKPKCTQRVHFRKIAHLIGAFAAI
jgi:hypothetical protein